MSKDHIGIPKFIEKGFTFNGKSTYCYDSINHNIYVASINKLGVEEKYYDEDVEKELLSEDVEYNFSLFYKKFIDATDLNELINLLNDNKQIIKKFVSFMYVRSKKTLKQVNDESIIAQTICQFNHSDLLRLNIEMQMDPFRICGNNYNFYPIINQSRVHFINNSVGFSLFFEDKEVALFIPLSSTKGIIAIDSNYVKNDNKSFFYSNDNKINTINKNICKSENIYGNGFIFGDSENLLKSYISLIE